MEVKEVHSIHEAGALGLLIRRERHLQGLRQQDLADLALVSVRFLSELEKGKASVEFQKVLAVLGALGLDLLVKSRRSEP